MSSNIRQIFLANPTTTFVSNDLMYLGRSPYAATDDMAFTYSSLIPINTKGDLFTWSTAATRLAVGANGTLLTPDSTAATGLKWTTATYPATTTINQILYSSANNVVGEIATQSNAALVTDNSGVPSFTASLTDGQLLIGGTGAAPIPASLTAGVGTAIDVAPNSITINTVGGGFDWVQVAGTATATNPNTVYVPTNVALTSFDLPVSPVLGDTFIIKGLDNTGGWAVVTGPGETIYVGNGFVTGAGDSVDSTDATDSAVFRCINASPTIWSADSLQGSLFLNTMVSGTQNSVNTSLIGQNGTGAFVGENSPSLTTPDLGIPSAGDLLNCTNLPLTTGVTGILGIANGGTDISTYTLGDILYSSATDVLSKLAGNTTTTKQYLSQTGTGVISAAPAWAAIDGADITGAALTKGDDTNVTLTLGGTPGTALLRAASITAGWTGTLAVTRGGTGTGTTFTAGSVVFAGGSGVYSQDNTNFFWDDGNKRLGIGTASPTVPLDVEGALRITSTFLLNSSALLNGNYIIFNNNTNAYAIQQIDNGGANYFRLGRNGFSDLVFDSAGKVGISTATPSEQLDVNGNINISGSTPQVLKMGTISTLSRNGTTGELTIATNTGDIILAPNENVTISAPTINLTQDTNFALSGGVNGFSIDGNTFSVDGTNNCVGFGTTTPESAIHVVGERTNTPTIKGIHIGMNGGTDAAIEIVASSATQSSYIDFGYPSVDFRGRILYGMSPDAFAITVAGGTVVQSLAATTGYWTSTNIGIGTNSPSSIAKLHVQTSGVGGDYGLYITNFASGAGWGMTMQPSTASDMEYVRFNSSAGTQIGSIASGTSQTVTVYNTTSDRRLKENIVDFENAIDYLSNIKIRNYNFKSAPDYKMIGFIADELEDAGFDFMVTGKRNEVDNDGNVVPQQVDFSKLVPVLAAAIKELNRKILELENKIH